MEPAMKRHANARRDVHEPLQEIPGIPIFGRYRYTVAEPSLVTHRHPDVVEICYLAEGRQVYRVGGRSYCLEAGDLFVTFPDEEHSSGDEPTGRGQLYWIQLELPVKNHFLGLPGDDAFSLANDLLSLNRLFYGGDEIKNRFEAIWSWLGADTKRKTLKLQAALVMLLEEIIAASQLNKPHQLSALNQLLSYIDDHIEHYLTPADLADACGLSESWFKAKFRTLVGMPPGEYVQRRKVEKAAEWLREGRYNATETAYRLKFSSSQYFSSVFKRFTGKTPKQVIKSSTSVS